MHPVSTRSLDILVEEINALREKMIYSGTRNGLTNETTIKFSQQLDELIYEYQQTTRPYPVYSEKINFTIHNMLYWPEAVC